MKKIFAVIAAACALSLTACEKDDPFKLDCDEQVFIAEKVYLELASDCLRATEMTDIFDSYQAVRSDREAAVALVGTYIRFRELYYDELLSDYGDVFISDREGCDYSCRFQHYLKYMNHNASYYAVRKADHSFSFNASCESGSGDLALSFDGRTEDGTIRVGNVRAEFEAAFEDFILKMHTPDGVELTSPMADPAKGHRYFPVSGSLVIEYLPASLPCTFLVDYKMSRAYTLTLTFSEDTYTVEDQYGYLKKLPAKPSQPPYTVDY